jgi:hypothetical protein
MINGSLQARARHEFDEHMASCRRMIAGAAPQLKLAVLETAVRESANLTRIAGLDTVDTIDRFNAIADEAGLVAEHGQDEVQAALARAVSPPLDDIPAPGWRKSIIAADALQFKKFKPLRFVVPGLIPEGASLLVSRPKLGKSWLVLDLCIAIAAGRFTLGELKPTEGDILYLALEDGERRLQNRMTKLLPTFGSAWPKRLEFATDWPRANEGGIADIEEWCKSVTCPTAIAIDTLERFRPRQTANQNSYAVDYQAVAELQKIAMKYNVAIVIVHHDRKAQADDVFDTISGTLGLSGAADNILLMKRESRGVILYVRGRDIEESESALMFSKDSCRWTIQGPASEVHKSNEREKVIDALIQADGPMKVIDIIIAANLASRAAADTLLHRMASDGDIMRTDRGMYGLPERDCKIGKKERCENQDSDIVQ